MKPARTLLVVVSAVALLAAACGDSDTTTAGGSDRERTVEIDMVDDAGTFEIGCHQPGHYEVGMTVTVTVS